MTERLLIGGIDSADAEYQQSVLEDIRRESREEDRVNRLITYRRFVSKSKGWRNGKRRLRKRWQEVHLVKYQARFHTWDKFPFDDCASEILGGGRFRAT